MSKFYHAPPVDGDLFAKKLRTLATCQDKDDPEGYTKTIAEMVALGCDAHVHSVLLLMTMHAHGFGDLTKNLMKKFDSIKLENSTHNPEGALSERMHTYHKEAMRTVKAAAAEYDNDLVEEPRLLVNIEALVYTIISQWFNSLSMFERMKFCADVINEVPDHLYETVHTICAALVLPMPREVYEKEFGDCVRANIRTQALAVRKYHLTQQI